MTQKLETWVKKDVGEIMINGQKLIDTTGNVLHAHGGFIIQKDDFYYWFGENRTGDIRVSCYRSSDLSTWEHRNDVLTYHSSTMPHYVRSDIKLLKSIKQTEEDQPVIKGCNIERPKVIYNEKTKKYVMWMHYENGIHYGDARCAVAVCDKIDGDYTYLGSFNPVGNMSRDCTVFVDDDKTAYFISAARENADIIIYRLSEDYLSIDEQIKTLWPGQCREAPTLFKRNDIYYMLSSACTGWAPNQGKYAVASSIMGIWSPLMEFGDATTYRSQPAFVLPIQGSKESNFLYVGDRWNGEIYSDSTYVFLPIQFDKDNKLSLPWGFETKIDMITGIIHNSC